jgi:hypothetical protein
MKGHDDRPDASAEEGKGREDAGTPPPAPFDPPVRDPAVLALLKGLRSSATPEPMQIPTTDGELSASFTGAPREAPRAVATPAPEARVVVDPKAGKKAKPKPSPEQLASTFRNRPGKGPPLVPIAGALLVVVIAGAWFLRGRETTPEMAVAPPAPVTTTVPAAISPPSPAPVLPIVEPPAPVGPATRASAVAASPAPTPSAREPGRASQQTTPAPGRDPGSSPF